MFVIVEGVDGSGKTTFINLFSRRLKEIKDRQKVVKTREPYQLSVEALKGKTPEEIYRAFMEDRKNHVEKVIGPSLKKNKIVISDRYWPSTYAYESLLGIPEERIIEDNIEFPQPDVMILLSPPVQVILNRNSMTDQFDRFAAKRIEQLMEKYFEIAEYMEKNLGTKVIILDDENAARFIEDVIFSIF